MRRFLLLFFVLGASFFTPKKVKGQVYLYGSNSISPRYVNPALTAQEKEMDVTVLSRFQWLGLKNSPKSYLLLFDSPINRILKKQKEQGNSRVGFMALHSTKGVQQYSEFNGSFAYAIKLTFVENNSDFERQVSHVLENIEMKFGVNYSYIFQQVNYNSLSYDLSDGVDEYANSLSNTVGQFNFGGGVSIGNEFFEIGFSAPYVLDQAFIGGSGYFDFQSRFFLPISTKFKLAPYFRISINGINTGRTRFGAILNYKELIGLGFGKYSTNSLEGFFSCKLGQHLKLNYNFAIMNNTGIASNRFGSHEIGLRYRFIENLYKD